MRDQGPLALNHIGKYLQIHLLSRMNVEDEGAFTTPWTATIIYARDPAGRPEGVFAENRYESYNNKEFDVPRAEKPDF
jgi:hypothetical protein